MLSCFFSFFFFNDTATTEIYTLSLHDALPISKPENGLRLGIASSAQVECTASSLQEAAPLDITHKAVARRRDRKSTRLNSSHSQISYAVFCLKKKKKKIAHEKVE